MSVTEIIPGNENHMYETHHINKWFNLFHKEFYAGRIRIKINKIADRSPS